jgi:transketolase
MSDTNKAQPANGTELDQLSIDTIRTLSIDAVQQAKSGHPGTPAVKARIAIEQASTFGWDRYVGETGQVIGMKTFGASAPLKELQKKFGFQPERVVAAAKTLLGKA